ncbi:MAG: lactonase family protein [Paludibacter sp.]|nr:lactonase family protein [Paludibacter sp.]
MMRTLLFSVLICLILPLQAKENKYRLLIGTYTNTGKSEGIYTYEIDLDKFVFTQKSVAKEMVNPSYLALTTDKKYVYAVSESGTASKTGAFAFDEPLGKLSFINSSDTHGSGPCFVSATKHHVITANYNGGSISVFGRNENGSLTDVLQLIQHVGGSIDPIRQTAPHVHQVKFTLDGKYLLVNDLGTDKVTVYSYNPNAKSDILVAYDSIQVKAGSGPRHLTFSEDGKRVYLLQEMDGTITVLKLDKGKLTKLQETTVVKKTDIETGAADIHLSPDERFLYATNRGTANDISCFSVTKNGTLTFVQQYLTGGVGPRNFSLTPDGKYLLIGNQRTDNITIFKRNTKTGELTNTGKSLEVGAPVCLIFY